MLVLPGWDECFMCIARTVATRSTCLRKQVGCVLVSGRRVIATGYNSSKVDGPYCTEVGCEMVHGHCVRGLHAEVHAVSRAAKYGINLSDTTAYITASPCGHCMMVLEAAGVSHVLFSEKHGP